MKKIYSIVLLLITGFAYGQTTITYAGIPNDDPYTKVTSTTSNVDLDQTYFALPEGMCFDPNGHMYITEANRIRLITGGSKIHIRAGILGKPAFSEGYNNGTSTQASFRTPSGIVCNNNGDLFVCDALNHCIRKVSKYGSISNNQIVTTFAGANPSANFGVSGSSDGTGTNARFNEPRGITKDASGNFYVADYLNFTIRKITPAGVVSTLAGKAGVEGTADGTGSAARFGGPWGITMYDANNLIVTDQWNTNIRMVNINTGVVTTVAGPTTGPSPGKTDGKTANAKFSVPKGIVVIEGLVYIGDENLIRRIDIDNDEVITFAGIKGNQSIKDGAGTVAEFTEITGLATDGKGSIYVSEASVGIESNVIRKVAIDELVAVADFVANKTNLKVDERASVEDISTGSTITTRKWTITPSNSHTYHVGDENAKIIEISFQATGFYEMKLEVTNDYNSDNKTVESYFNVSTTSSGIETYNANESVNVYPNPASSSIHLDLDPEWSISSTTLRLFAPSGLLLKEFAPKADLDVSMLPAGVYFLTLHSGENSAVKKIIIQH